MNKTLIALAVGTLFASITAVAETDSKVETVVVTANRTTEQKFDVLAAVDVFDRQTIEQIHPVSLADLLSRVAGISTATTGTEGSATSIFVRGGNSDHVLILLDGVRIGSATLGVKNLGEISMQMIERVEVIRGPRAALWGSDAIGGVIQIFTRQLTAGQGQMGVEFGSDRFWRAHAAVGFGNANHHYTVAATTERSNGFDAINPDPNGETDDDGYSRKSLAINGNSQLTEQVMVGLSAQIDKGTTEFDSGFGGNESDYDNHFIQLHGAYQLGTSLVKLTVANAVDDSHDNEDKRFPGSAATIYQTSRDQVNLLGSMPVNDNLEFTAGYDWYDETVKSTTLYSQTSRNTDAAFVVGRYSMDKLKLEGSVRHDTVGDTESETTHQVAIGYQVTDDILLSFTQGTAFKAPTFNDLYWPEEFGSQGNPNLKSESADNQEFLARIRDKNYSVELSIYETNYDDLIEWGYDPVSTFYQPGNIEHAKIKGAELTLNVEALSSHHRLSLTHIDAKNSTTGQQLAKRPHFTGYYEWLYQSNQWNVSVELNHQGKRNDVGGQLPAYTLANLNFSYAISDSLNLRAKVRNLADKDYVQAAAWPSADVAAYQGASRNYTLALDYRF